jgi:hypothetical protein
LAVFFAAQDFDSALTVKENAGQVDGIKPWNQVGKSYEKKKIVQ